MDKAKTELVRSWFIKAQHDLDSAMRLAVEPNPILDTAIYHCQQAAEKSLKAFLVHHDIEFEKSHNLLTLLEQCEEIDVSFRDLTDAAENLTPFATAYRYPDEFFGEPIRKNLIEREKTQKKYWHSLESAYHD